MAEFQFKCPQCGKTIEADDSLRGQVVVCPHCDKGIVVPHGKPKLGVLRKDGPSSPLGQRTIGKPDSIPLEEPDKELSKPDETRRRYKIRLRKRWIFLIIVICAAVYFGGTLIHFITDWRFRSDMTDRFRSGVTSFENGEYDKALRIFRPWAEQGNPLAQSYMGRCYYAGLGVKENKEEAMQWWFNAAHQEDSYAQLMLGFCYYSGMSLEEGASKAVYWWDKSAHNGQPEALCSLGNCYLYGDGVRKFYGEAVKLFRLAAEQGNAEAQYKLAECLSGGTVMEMYEAEAAKWFGLAAEQGHVQAQLKFAVCLLEGKGIKANVVEAVKWFRKAAEQEHVEAQFHLAKCLIEGIGTETDEAEAANWFLKAAGKGHVEAQFRIAECYMYGKGVERDEKSAEEWYHKAAENGHKGALQELNKIADKRKERIEKEQKIEQLSKIETKIVGQKKRVNDIIRGILGGDWIGFNARKITMTDASVNVVEEQPLKHTAKKLSEKDSMGKIDELLLAAQDDAKRLEGRLNDFVRVKELYDEKELESRRMTCAACRGKGSVTCTKCDGHGEVVNKKRVECPTCYGDKRVSVFVTCDRCRGAKWLGIKCAKCKGKGRVDVQFSLTREKCGYCNGTGRGENKECPKCLAEGKVKVERLCTTCNGRGDVVNNKKETCPVCEGKCTINCERCNGRGFTYRPKVGD